MKRTRKRIKPKKKHALYCYTRSDSLHSIQRGSLFLLVVGVVVVEVAAVAQH